LFNQSTSHLENTTQRIVDSPSIKKRGMQAGAEVEMEIAVDKDVVVQEVDKLP
jgi:hypothetical protein